MISVCVCVCVCVCVGLNDESNSIRHCNVIEQDMQRYADMKKKRFLKLLINLLMLLTGDQHGSYLL